jgi:hypothetical protein
MTKPQAKQLVVCVDNDGFSASLEKRKIYVALRDTGAEKNGLRRIIDESGDDYLYPRRRLFPLDCSVACDEKGGIGCGLMDETGDVAPAALTGIARGNGLCPSMTENDVEVSD